jgi:hypothetical protein
MHACYFTRFPSMFVETVLISLSQVNAELSFPAIIIDNVCDVLEGDAAAVASAKPAGYLLPPVVVSRMNLTARTCVQAAELLQSLTQLLATSRRRHGGRTLTVWAAHATPLCRLITYAYARLLHPYMARANASDMPMLELGFG